MPLQSLPHEPADGEQRAEHDHEDRQGVEADADQTPTQSLEGLDQITQGCLCLHGRLPGGVGGDYRRRGIGKWLYEARKDLVRRHNKRGIIAGGYMAGYEDHMDAMDTETYLRKVAAGELYDPTLTFQMENGFRLVTVLHNYLRDQTTDGDAALIVWDNPDFQPA